MLSGALRARVGVVKRFYRSRDGRCYFNFEFVDHATHIDIYCKAHPPLNGRDSGVCSTHLYSSGKICFVAGREARTQARAEELARQWAEYFLEYRRTGIAQR